MNEINDEKSVRKEKKTKEKASAKSIRKYSSKRTALLSAQKKKSSPVKVLINSFNVQTDSIRRERKTICELYAQSRTHFILLEKAMQDTLKEFSTVHTLVSKAAKSLQRIHRAYKYQKQPHLSWKQQQKRSTKNNAHEHDYGWVESFFNQKDQKNIWRFNLIYFRKLGIKFKSIDYNYRPNLMNLDIFEYFLFPLLFHKDTN